MCVFSVRRHYRDTLHWRNTQPHQLRLLHQLPVVRRHHRRPAVPPLEETQLVPTHQGTDSVDPSTLFQGLCGMVVVLLGRSRFTSYTAASHQGGNSHVYDVDDWINMRSISLWLLLIIILNDPISRLVPKSKAKLVPITYFDLYYELWCQKLVR